MQSVLWLCATLGAAVAGGLLFRRLQVPSGAMVGAMAAVAILNIITEGAYFPFWLRQVMQVLSGAMIGSRIRRSDVTGLVKLAFPLCVMVPCLLFINLLAGLAIHKIGGFDLATALFSSAPGGVTEMSMIASDVGADTARVSVMQLFRLFGVILIFPALFRALPGLSSQGEGRAQGRDAGPERPMTPANLCLTALAAAIGGTAGYLLGIPAGAMIGSMVLCSAMSAIWGRVVFPAKLVPPLQIASGAYIGALWNMAIILSFGQLVLPLAILLTSLFINTFGIGALMYKLARLDRRTALFASTPGGLVEMTLMAADAGADVTTVSILQTIRLFGTILLFPPLLQLAIHFFG